jgi:hypothetical protein
MTKSEKIIYDSSPCDYDFWEKTKAAIMANDPSLQPEEDDDFTESIRKKVADLLSIGRKDLAETTCYNWIQSMQEYEIQDSWQYFEENIKTYDKEHPNTVFLAFSDLGLWTGRQVGIPIWRETLAECVSKIMSVSGTYDTRIVQRNKHLVINRIHHDGTNIFTVMKLKHRRIKNKYREVGYTAEYGYTARYIDVTADFLHGLFQPDRHKDCFSLVHSFMQSHCSPICLLDC